MGFIVAVDGPAGSGKGTVTKIVGEKEKLIYIDTGAMYRCVALDCLNKNVEPENLAEIKKILSEIHIELKIEEKQKVFLNNVEVTEKIRTAKVDSVVAKYAEIKIIRDKMTVMQREMGKVRDIIMEGRDIGTTVFPNADVKIFLDCSIEERAKRRYKQYIDKGMDITFEEVLESIKERHKLETQREISPLIKAKDAIYIDSSNMSIEEVVNMIVEIINRKKI